MRAEDGGFKGHKLLPRGLCKAMRGIHILWSRYVLQHKPSCSSPQHSGGTPGSTSVGIRKENYLHLCYRTRYACKIFREIWTLAGKFLGGKCSLPHTGSLSHLWGPRCTLLFWRGAVGHAFKTMRSFALQVASRKCIRNQNDPGLSKLACDCYAETVECIFSADHCRLSKPVL